MSGIDNPALQYDSRSNLSVVSSNSHLINSCSASPTSDMSPSRIKASSKSIDTSASDSFVESEKLCGWGNLHPPCLQKLRTPQCVLFWLCWAGALQGLVVNGFINVVITTIEKRYQLKSTETGLIAGSYDIASFIFLMPISYLGGTRSKSSFIGWGLTVLACGCLVFSLPYFLAGPYTFSEEQDFFCQPFDSLNYTTPETCLSKQSSLSNFKYVFFLGQFLNGLGAVPLYTLGCTLLDENVTTKMSSVYLGIFYTMAIVGPAIGYVLGGQMLKIYVDVGVDVNELGLSPSSTVWVGAWWIGFVLAAVLGLLIAIPMLAFPKSLPTTEKVKVGKVTEMHQNLEESEATSVNFGSSLSDMPKSLKLLISNPTFVFLSLAGASEGILLAGLATFLPKLIESQFSYQASSAAFIVGVVTIPGAGGGNLLGGYIVKRFKMKCASIIRVCIAFCAICLAFSFIFILHCPDAQFAGVNLNVTTNSDELATFASQCNADCACSGNNYDPICGIDNTIYFSPCYAGCQEVFQQNEIKAYGNCKCINGTGLNMTLNGRQHVIQAKREKCDNNCVHGPLFLAVIFFCMFFTFLVSMPSLSATLRCVAETQKSFALGIQWMAVRILGTIPAPVFFGWLIDKSCTLWQESCTHEAGSCLFYSNQQMSTNILIIVVLVKCLSCIFFFIAWFSYRPPEPSKSVCDQISPRLNPDTDGAWCISIRPVPEDGIMTCQASTSSVF